jgi:hypothetical protein
MILTINRNYTLNSINQLISVMEMHHVSTVLETEFLNIT